MEMNLKQKNSCVGSITESRVPQVDTTKTVMFIEYLARLLLPTVLLSQSVASDHDEQEC